MLKPFKPYDPTPNHRNPEPSKTLTITRLRCPTCGQSYHSYDDDKNCEHFSKEDYYGNFYFTKVSLDKLTSVWKTIEAEINSEGHLLKDGPTIDSRGLWYTTIEINKNYDKQYAKYLAFEADYQRRLSRYQEDINGGYEKKLAAYEAWLIEENERLRKNRLKAAEKSYERLLTRVSGIETNESTSESEKEKLPFYKTRLGELKSILISGKIDNFSLKRSYPEKKAE